MADTPDPRFAVLEHDHLELHWDLLFEHDGVLKTWRLAEYPPRPGRSIAALALGDHRLTYLDYEGSVSGDRGRVVRLERGTYEIVEGDWTSDRLLLALQGRELNGLVLLQRIDHDAWRFGLPDRG